MFRNLKLSMKLTFGFAMVLILSLAVTVVGVVYMNRIGDSTRMMYDHPYTVHTEILQVQRNIINIDRELGYLLTEDDRQVIQARSRNIDELEQEALDAFDLLYERFLGDARLLDKVNEALVVWKPIRDEVLRLKLSGQDLLAVNFDVQQNAPQIELIENLLQDVVDFAKGSAANFKTEADEDVQNAVTLVLSLLGAVFVVGILSAVMITRSITRPVAALLTFTQGIAQGNLALAAVDYKSNDEIGTLTQAVNQMQVNLRELAMGVTDAVNIVSSSSAEMSAGAQETSAAVEELASSANQFAGAVDQMSANTQDMAGSAERTSELSQQGQVEIDRTIEAMDEINEVVSALAVEIRELGRQSDEIGQIVTLITDIADQTNLLALNAAIEAARAGEQGRGFAVVAEEVRKLAEQSAGAADEITQLLQQIRAAAQNSVDRTDVGTDKVREGMEVVTETGRMFGEIADIIETVVQEIAEVASGTQELAAGAEEMGATTEEQSASAQQMAALSVQVTEAAEAVKREIGRFRLN